MHELWTGDVGKALRFAITSGVTPYGWGGTVAVKWHLNDGSVRNLSVVCAASGLVEYTVSAREFTRPGVLVGQLTVSGATGLTFHTSTFILRVKKSLR